MAMFQFDSSEMQTKLTKLSTKATAAMLMILATKAKSVESEMKSNRPWTDRTGQAKATLNVTVSQPAATVLRMTLAHGVDYGIWLELAHNKNWAIVKPTLDKEAPKVLNSLNGFLDKLGG